MGWGIDYRMMVRRIVICLTCFISLVTIGSIWGGECVCVCWGQEGWGEMVRRVL